jgi:predicted solute-binding protein
VWALWLGREDAITPSLVETLLRARQWGWEHIDQVIHREALRLDTREDLVRRYLCDIMQYEMTPAHEEALRRFAEECRRLGLVLVGR